MAVLFNNTPKSCHDIYCKPNFVPRAEVLEVCGLGLVLPPSVALHILCSSGSVHPENHGKKEPEVVEEGTSRKMRVDVTLDMQNSMNKTPGNAGFGGWRKTQTRERHFRC